MNYSSTVNAKGNNRLENITISGGHAVVTFQGKGEIKNCIVKNGKSKGIDLTQTSASFKIDKSKIINNGGKGIYVQKGRSIEITNNEFYGNIGEGIDIREKIKGIISGNVIRSNNESGIELIVGSSNLKITGNNIRNNKASGIATQFYEQASKDGKILVKNNSLVGNNSYGFNCKAPSGGEIPKGYWNDSIELINNVIQNNKIKAIADACKFIKAIGEEEEKSNKNIESAEVLKQSEISPEEKTKIAEEEAKKAQEELEKEKEVDKQINEIFNQQNNSNSQIQTSVEKIEKSGKIKNFFFGPDLKSLKIIKEELEKTKIRKTQLENINRELENMGNLPKIEANILAMKEMENQIERYFSFIDSQMQKKSAFGWLIKLFYKW